MPVITSVASEVKHVSIVEYSKWMESLVFCNKLSLWKQLANIFRALTSRDFIPVCGECVQMEMQSNPRNREVTPNYRQMLNVLCCHICLVEVLFLVFKVLCKVNLEH